MGKAESAFLQIKIKKSTHQFVTIKYTLLKKYIKNKMQQGKDKIGNTDLLLMYYIHQD